MESRSLLVREFYNLCGNFSLVAVDLPSKMVWILIKLWMADADLEERTFERDRVFSFLTEM